jgi:CubicO group peptidase (beta-lactamase class C family)
MSKRMRWVLILISQIGAAVALDGGDIDDFVRSEMARQQIPGVAVAVIRNGAILHLEGYGLANLEHAVPVSADTVFQSGSLGKLFTAQAVLLLADDRKLKLDESICTYLEDAPAGWRSVTVRHLLNHTSGLGEFEVGDRLDLQRNYTDDELLRKAYAIKPRQAPGTRWDYSNTGYIILGILENRVSGRHYGDVLQERLFGPLGMSSAKLIDTRAIVPHRAAGYLLQNGEFRNPDWVSPTLNATADGSLQFSVRDLVKWETAVRTRKILSADSWSQLGRAAPMASGATFPYGCGVWLNPQGYPAWAHSGSWQGFRTFYLRILESDLTVFVLANLAQANPAALAYGIAACVDPRYAVAKAREREDDEAAIRALAQKIFSELTEATPAVSAAKDEWRRGLANWESCRTVAHQAGKVERIGFYGRESWGDESLYRYRARGSVAAVEFVFVISPAGVVTALTVRLLDGVDAPILQQG